MMLRFPGDPPPIVEGDAQHALCAAIVERARTPMRADVVDGLAVTKFARHDPHT